MKKTNQREDLANMRCIIDNMRQQSFSEIEYVLQKYDYDLQDSLASFVASICEVDYADMLSQNTKSNVSLARWLYWYALRFMTNESYEQIAERTAFDGYKYTKDAIRKAVEKMGSIINTERKWQNRWVLVRKMINTWDDAQHIEYKNLEKKYKVKISVPKEIKDNIEVSFQ